jgi:hypothetical protein
MKEAFFIVGLFLLSVKGNAQTDQWRIGLDAGFNVGYLIDIASTSNLKPENFGLHAGLGIQYKLNHLFKLRTGLYYSELNNINEIYSIISFNNDIDTSLATTHFSYLKMPLTTRMSFGNQFRVNVVLGGYAAVLLNQYDRYEKSRFFLDEKINNMDFYKSFDFGLIGGMGLSYEIKKKYVVSIEQRYDLGIYDIAQEVPNQMQITFPRTYTAATLLGLWINIGKE